MKGKQKMSLEDQIFMLRQDFGKLKLQVALLMDYIAEIDRDLEKIKNVKE